MSWHENELVQRGLLEPSKDGQLVLSARGRAELKKGTLIELLLQPPPGESFEFDEGRSAAEEERFEQLQQQLNGRWEERQNDPDNWLVIPEFGVMPQDVSFEGFALPIFGADDAEGPWKRPIRDAVRAVREEARRRFGSLQELLAAVGRVVAETDGPRGGRKWSADEVFAFHYDCFFRELIWAERDYRRAKPRCIEHLARAVEVAVYIRSSDLPRPDFVQRVRREHSKKGGHARQAPSQEAKKGVKEWWDAWQKNPQMYASEKEFAEAMADKYFPVLKSKDNRTIRRWCGAWRRAQSQELAKH